MRIVDYTDDDGLIQRAQLPDSAADDEAALGVPVGVDVIDRLALQGMPYETAKRLQNELRRRGFWDKNDVRRARATEQVFAALQSAYKTDVAAVINLLMEVQDNE